MTTLYLTCTPIGNSEDLSHNALATLKKADLLIGEEFSETSKFLKKNSIQGNFELFNEHSNEQDIDSLMEKIKKSSITCLFSDGGSPLLEDPGRELVNGCIRENIPIKVLPGPSAFLVALLLSGFSSSPFTFIGFLPRESHERITKFRKFLQLGHTLILYETPYRYKKAFEEILKLLHPDMNVFLGLDLTSENEVQIRGKPAKILKELKNLPKANPVLVVSQPAT